MKPRAAMTNFRPRNHRGEAGFTMAEIAIALGVIAFALVAIIGILPIGLSVQKDNREETIITQDARILLEAVKTGGRNDTVSDLGSFVANVDGTNFATGIPTADLIRFLSDSSMTHTTILYAISGGIASRGSDLAFRYQVVNHVLNPMDTNSLPFGELFGGAKEFTESALWLTNSVHEVRLRFAWPVRPDGKLGAEANRFVMRALVAGLHTNGVMYGQQYYNPEP